MSLLRLSLIRAPRVGRHMPPPPTNEERVRAFRAYLPVQLANAPLTASIRAAQEARMAREYAERETLDGRIPTTEI